MNKLQKTAKGIDTILKISYWANIAAAVLLGILIFNIWRVYGAMPDISEATSVVLDFGLIEFTVDPSAAHNQHAFIYHMCASSLIPFAQVIFWCMFIRCGRKILAPMIENRPFHNQMADQLHRMGWLNIGLGIVDNLGELFLFGNLIPGYDLDALFANDMILGYEYSISWDFRFLLWSAVLFLLSYVFKHGWELQQLSDETL